MCVACMCASSNARNVWFQHMWLFGKGVSFCLALAHLLSALNSRDVDTALDKVLSVDLHCFNFNCEQMRFWQMHAGSLKGFILYYALT